LKGQNSFFTFVLVEYMFEASPLLLMLLSHITICNSAIKPR